MLSGIQVRNSMFVNDQWKSLDVCKDDGDVICSMTAPADRALPSALWKLVPMLPELVNALRCFGDTSDMSIVQLNRALITDCKDRVRELRRSDICDVAVWHFLQVYGIPLLDDDKWSQDLFVWLNERIRTCWTHIEEDYEFKSSLTDKKYSIRVETYDYAPAHHPDVNIGEIVAAPLFYDNMVQSLPSVILGSVLLNYNKQILDI